MWDIDTNKENNIFYKVELERKEDSGRPKNNSTEL
jgi:hypothetical protein